MCRITKEFIRLVSFDSESYHEREIVDYLKERLLSLGLTVQEDDAAEKMGHKNEKSAGNIYAILKGNTAGEPILFSAHTDTVSPGKGKKAIVHADGKITSDGTTVLGADDVTGIVSILEALTVIQEKNLPHADIEVLFSVAEEPYCKGAKAFDYGKIKSKIAYVLDSGGELGTAAIAAPTILSVNVKIYGKSAHAGFAPHEGINALTAAVNALHQIAVGRVSAEETVNFGTITGGIQKNVVPDFVEITGEIRSSLHEKAVLKAERIKSVFTAEAEKSGAQAEVTVTEEIRAYKISEEEEAVKRFKRAANELGISNPVLREVFGGSDNNSFVRNGIRGIVVANPRSNAHTKQESTTVEGLHQSAQITLKLMTIS